MRYLSSTDPAGRLRIVLTLLALLPAVARAQIPADAAARADAVLAAHAQVDAPGVTVAVVRNGAIVYSGARGLASLEQRTALTPESVLDIGSVAKQFTGFAIALLESQGKLSLDDDIRKHLPEVTDFGRRITIRNLLNHTSGLREIYNTMTIGGWQAGDAMTQENALRLVSVQPKLQFEPGSEHLYNNTGYMLLSDIVERVTGMQFHDWMRDNVFLPLGMRNTVIMHTLGQVIPGSADSYEPRDDGFVRVFDNSTIQGAGGIYSTSHDMAQWLRNWSTPVVGTRAVLDRVQERTVLTKGDTLAYALGVSVASQRGLRSVAHGGSSAAFRTAMVHYPELSGGIIVQSNHARINAGRVATELAEIFFGDRMQPAVAAGESAAGARPTSAEGPAWQPSAADLAAFAGRFYSPEVEALYRLSVEDGTLVLRHGRIGERKLTPRTRDVFAAPGSLGEITFERDSAGKITGFTVSNGRTRGVAFQRMQ